MRLARGAAFMWGSFAASFGVIGVLNGSDIERLLPITFFGVGMSGFFAGVAIIAGALEKK